jgi:DNA-binding CsgD family transcriptional regulator
MELSFAGLHQLCAPMLDRLELLPESQREALGTAFGLVAGYEPDRFFVGLAALSLLSAVAEEQPLLCVVDDLQWLDVSSVQALAFVARRLDKESVGMLFVVRRPNEDLDGIPELVLDGLDADHASALLDSVIAGPLDAEVRDRIIAEARGNPLALLELPRGLAPAELAGGFGLSVREPVPGRVERSFQRRLDELPAETRRLLRVAAADPVGDPLLLRRAAARLRIAEDAVVPAVSAGWLDLGARVTFRHPLIRSAVYRSAPPEERRAAHSALGEATDIQLDPERRAWHRAQGTSGPDEDIASELERSASFAQSRGGAAAAAALLARSAELTLDSRRRSRRALDAARAKQLAGAPEAALELLATIDLGLLGDLERARVDELRAQIAFSTSRGRDVPTLLVRAGKQLEPLHPGLAREVYLDALGAALFVGRLATHVDLVEVAKTVGAAPSAPEPPRPPDVLLDGLATLVTNGFDAATPILRRALRGFLGEAVPVHERIRWLWLIGHVSGLLWDYDAGDTISAREVQLARDSGALSLLPVALSQRLGILAQAGQYAAVTSLLHELQAVTRAMGTDLAPYVALVAAVFRGHEIEASQLIEASIEDVRRRGEGLGLTLICWAQALLCNSLGRYDEALAAAKHGSEGSRVELFSTWALVELIEAATRAGVREQGTDALQLLSTSTRASGSDWALGVEARSRALLSDGKAAASLYEEAIDRLGRTRLRPDLARARLLYGEWLRRQHRRLAAREQLRTAREMFTRLGMEAFEARAAIELQASGATARKRTVETSDELTGQEAQIAQLASLGLSNPEISARLFISRRTVEYHLHNIFGKLGISSRNQLARALAREGSQPSGVAGMPGSQT